MDEPGINTIIFGVSPLGYGQMLQIESFKDERLPWTKYLTATNITLKKNKMLMTTDGKLTPFGATKLYLNPGYKAFNQLHTFFDYFIKYYSTAFHNPNPTIEINLSKPIDQINQVKDIANSSPNNLVKDQKNGSDKVFKWESRRILESISQEGDIHILFKRLKSELDKRGIRLVVYETPTPKHNSAPQIYPYGFFEKYQKYATRMFNKLEIQYIDLSDFFPWNGQIMWDFIHADLHPRNILHQHILNLIYEDYKNAQEDF